MDGVQPSLHVEYKSSHVKQYFKEQHALRSERPINNPMDFYVRKAVANLSYLRDLGHQVNRKLLEVERISHHCVLTQEVLDRLQRPTVENDQRVSALRFGNPRVMALSQRPSLPTWPRSLPESSAACFWVRGSDRASRRRLLIAADLVRGLLLLLLPLAWWGGQLTVAGSGFVRRVVCLP